MFTKWARKKKAIIYLPINSTNSVSPTKSTNSIINYKIGETNPEVNQQLVTEASKSSYKNEVENAAVTNPPKKTLTLKTISQVNFRANISIQKTINNSQEKEDKLIHNISNRPTEKFTSEQFERKWSEYKQLLLEKGQTSLASVFDDLPEVNNDQIIVSLNNKALQDEIIETKTEILDFLRQALNNYNLSLETKININLKTRKAYTPMEKFAKMSKKNPHLITLVKTFDMDINYPNN